MCASVSPRREEKDRDEVPKEESREERNRSRERERKSSRDRRSSSRDRHRKSSRHRSSRDRSSKSRDRRRRSRDRRDRRDSRDRHRRRRSPSYERRRRRSSSRDRHSRRRRSSSSDSETSQERQARIQRQRECMFSTLKGSADRYWDGFQWVDKPPAGVAAAVVSGTGVASIGHQKDRRVYVGNLPASVKPEVLKEFINAALIACGAVPPGVESPVLSVWLGPENKYSFIEVCSAECAQVVLGLNGISFNGVNLRLARPKTYNETGGLF